MEQKRNVTFQRPLFLTILIALAFVCISFVLQKPPAVSAASGSPSINLTNLVMKSGQTRQLRISGTNGKITWKSSKPSVARVNANGKITARKAGTAAITGRVNKKKYTCRVRVSKSGQKALVAYFSQTGTTKDVAEKIRSLTGADTLRIKAKNPYPDNYNRTVSRAKRELDRNARPKISSVATNMSSYDVVYIGYPIWWHSTPKVIDTFLETYNLRGKTIVPFCTSGGSNISESMDVIRSLCAGSQILEGYTAQSGSRSEIKNWLERIGLLETDTNTNAGNHTDTDTNAGNHTDTVTNTAPNTGNHTNADPNTGNGTNTDTNTNTDTDTNTNTNTDTNTSNGTNTDANNNPGTGNHAQPNQPAAPENPAKPLVVYFSMPETTNPDNMTQEEANSTVVINGEVLGNTQYVAYVIQQNTGADIFRIEPAVPYPTDHSTLVSLASDEKASGARPQIKDHITNLGQYDTIFVGYPNWWGDMPMILYSFFDEYDFSGKTIIPFNTHGGSGFSNTISTIAQLEPNAAVNREGFTVSRNIVQDAEPDILNWLAGLGYRRQ